MKNFEISATVRAFYWQFFQHYAINALFQFTMEEIGTKRRPDGAV